MSELLSILIAAVFSASMGLNAAAPVPGSAEAGPPPIGWAGGSATTGDARLAYQHAQSKADAGYKAAIGSCKKKPLAGRQVCLEDAKTANDGAIAAATATMDKASAQPKSAARPTGTADARSSAAHAAENGSRFHANPTTVASVRP